MEEIWGNLQIERMLSENGYTLLVVDRRTGKRYVKKYVNTQMIESYRILQQVRSIHLPIIYIVEEESDIYGDSLGMELEEYIQGETISCLLEKRIIFSKEETINLVVQICDGLSVIHSKGLVHRDIKPSNIVVMPNGKIIIIDFGIARITKVGKNQDTCLNGTPGYASPEQFGFSQTDLTGDIYSVGILMNEMLTKCFPQDKLCDPPLRYIVKKCINMNADLRYKDTMKLKKDLLKVKHHTFYLYKGRWIGISTAILATIIFMIIQIQLGNIKILNGNIQPVGQIREPLPSFVPTASPQLVETVQPSPTKKATPTPTQPIDTPEATKTIQEAPDFQYVVNQSEQDTGEDGGYINENGEWLLSGSYQDEGSIGSEYFYVTDTKPESTINFKFKNTGNENIKNPKVKFQFTNFMTISGTNDETYEYSNHAHGLGGYGDITWNGGKGITLQPGETTELFFLYLHNSAFLNFDASEASVKVTITADNCNSKVFEIPVRLKES